jgi:hypothetical protein
VATLREIATDILSYIVYAKVFSRMHAVSSVIVLGGIFLTMTCRVPINDNPVEQGKGTLTSTIKTDLPVRNSA